MAFVLTINNIFSISSGSGRDINKCPAIANALTLWAIMEETVLGDKDRSVTVYFELRSPCICIKSASVVRPGQMNKTVLIDSLLKFHNDIADSRHLFLDRR